jgi:hypothetical protein
VIDNQEGSIVRSKPGTAYIRSSRATVPTAFPLSRTIRTACALNSFVNVPPLPLGHDTTPTALPCDLGCLPNRGRFNQQLVTAPPPREFEGMYNQGGFYNLMGHKGLEEPETEAT